MQGGQKQRDNMDLVPCEDCTGNVRIKVPRNERLRVRSTVAAVLPADVNPHTIIPQRVFSAKPSRGVSNIAKVLVREQVYFQRHGEARVMQETKFERNSSDVVHRALSLEPMQVGPDWVAPDFSAWPDKVAQLVILNLEGNFHQIPTPEEFAERMNRIVHLGFGDNPTLGDQLISPKQGQRYEVGSLSRVRLCCPTGVATVLITVFPG
jgi:hypothetical protein